MAILAGILDGILGGILGDILECILSDILGLSRVVSLAVYCVESWVVSSVDPGWYPGCLLC